MNICKTCLIEREDQWFKFVIRNNKTYYYTKKCKVCLGVKVIKGKYNIKPKEQVLEKKAINKKLSQEQIDFLDKIKRKSGYIDVVDAYTLAHHFTTIFGYIDLTHLSIEQELTLMYEKLLKVNGN